MMAEDRAARIVHKLLSPHSSWEQFERILVSQQQPTGLPSSSPTALPSGSCSSRYLAYSCAWYSHSHR